MIFRNTAYFKEMILDVAVTAAASAYGFSQSLEMGLLAVLACVAMMIIHAAALNHRYRKIAELSEEIDRVLHSEEHTLISAQAEGELSILQNELRKMTMRLKEQSEMLQADKKRLSEAIEDIFHQLRTPLTAMNLSTEMLKAGSLPEEKRMQIARNLQRSIDRIRWQVETLLKISKIDAGTATFQQETVPVSKLVSMASEDLLIPMELRGQEFVVAVEDEQFAGDLRWSAEALGNLLKNAVEHTPEGGRITVKARETAIYTEIVVSDNGPGFSEDEIPMLFDRFFKGSNSSEGSIGIGLALARMIISEQNGMIKAENMPNGGASFKIRFYKSVV